MSLSQLSKALLESYDDELEEDLAQFSMPMSVDAAQTQAQEELTPVIVDIAKLLRGRPVLAEATRRWVNRKIQEIQGAELQVLYTDEEIAEMMQKLEEQDAEDKEES